MNIKSITVLQRENNCDIIYIRTDLKEAAYPFQGDLYLTFQAAKGTGLTYCKANFPGVEIQHTVTIQ